MLGLQEDKWTAGQTRLELRDVGRAEHILRGPSAAGSVTRRPACSHAWAFLVTMTENPPWPRGAEWKQALQGRLIKAGIFWATSEKAGLPPSPPPPATPPGQPSLGAEEGTGGQV